MWCSVFFWLFPPEFHIFSPPCLLILTCHRGLHRAMQISTFAIGTDFVNQILDDPDLNGKWVCISSRGCGDTFRLLKMSELAVKGKFESRPVTKNPRFTWRPVAHTKSIHLASAETCSYLQVLFNEAWGNCVGDFDNLTWFTRSRRKSRKHAQSSTWLKTRQELRSLRLVMTDIQSSCISTRKTNGSDTTLR